MRQHPDIRITLDLSDRLTDLVRDRIDCAIRISDLADSTLIAVRLAENRRVVVAAPAYLARRGTPKTLADLEQHDCLSLGESQSRGWTFKVGGELVNLKVRGALECNDGAVLHDWALARSGPDLALDVGGEGRYYRWPAGNGAGPLLVAGLPGVRGGGAKKIPARPGAACSSST